MLTLERHGKGRKAAVWRRKKGSRQGRGREEEGLRRGCLPRLLGLKRVLPGCDLGFALETRFRINQLDLLAGKYHFPLKCCQSIKSKCFLLLGVE